MRTVRRSLFCGVLVWMASGTCLENTPQAMDQTPASETVGEEEKGLEPFLQGIVLVTEQDAWEGLDAEQLKGVVNLDVPLPEPSQKFLEELREKYLGGPLTEEQLVKIKRAIIRFYRSQKRPVVAVRISRLDTPAGTVAFIISEGKIERVACDGGRWITPEHLETYVDLEPGEHIAQDVLLNNVDSLNHNPFRRSVVAFLPESEDGISDLAFAHPDRFPARIFAGADTSGTKFTGRARLYGGLTWGHAFGLNDLLHYQYTANTTLNKFQSHYGSYIYFLPWQDILTVFGLYETTHFNVAAGSTRKGKNAQASFRYTSPLAPLYGAFKQAVTLGIDYKNINTNIFFIDDSAPLFSRSINNVQLFVNYSLERVWKKNDLRLAVDLASSPGQLMPNDSKAAYHTLRPHAKNRYIYLRATLGDTYRIPRCFTLAGLIRIQASSGPLLPTEQFGLGGYNTVRGYYEYAFKADQALCANFEIRSPSLTMVKKWEDEWFFLGFIDYGLGYNVHPSPGNPSSGHLLGMGPGLRYQVDTHFSVRVDYGFRLLKVHGGSNRRGVAHLGVVGMY